MGLSQIRLIRWYYSTAGGLLSRAGAGQNKPPPGHWGQFKVVNQFRKSSRMMSDYWSISAGQPFPDAGTKWGEVTSARRYCMLGPPRARGRPGSEPSASHVWF